MREYRRVPALESGSKLSNPDLQDIGEKNYTDIILRYGNLTTKFPQLDTNAKTIVAAINELYAHPGGSIVIPNPPIGSGVELEQGGSLELEQGGVLDTEQGGGTVVGNLTSISIDGDIYTIEGGGGGSTVIPNPSIEVSGEVLDMLEIDNGSGPSFYKTSGFRFTEIVLAVADWEWRDSTSSYHLIMDFLGQDIPDQPLVFVTPEPNYRYDFDEYCRCQVRCFSLDQYVRPVNDSIHFVANKLPTIPLHVSVAYCNSKYYINA